MTNEVSNWRGASYLRPSPGQRQEALSSANVAFTPPVLSIRELGADRHARFAPNQFASSARPLSNNPYGASSGRGCSGDQLDES